MVTISVKLGGSQESEGGWRADAEGTNVKGGRKGGGNRKKGQEEDEDHPRAVENNRISEMEKHAKTTKSRPTSFLEVAEKPRLTQGHTTNLQMMLKQSLRHHDPLFLMWLIDRPGW